MVQSMMPNMLQCMVQSMVPSMVPKYGAKVWCNGTLEMSYKMGTWPTKKDTIYLLKHCLTIDIIK